MVIYSYNEIVQFSNGPVVLDSDFVFSCYGAVLFSLICLFFCNFRCVEVTPFILFVVTVVTTVHYCKSSKYLFFTLY
jgi:hypothetical protein